MNRSDVQGRPQRGWALPDSLLAIARSILMLLQLWRERCRMRRHLAVMNERELRDIGLCHADIADEIGRPFWRNIRDIKGRPP